MKMQKKIFLSLFLFEFAFIGVSHPVYADVNKVSFKLGSVKGSAKSSANTNRFIKCSISKSTSKTKGRNRKITLKKAENCRRTQSPKRFKNPRIGGLRIDACVRGFGWKESDAKRCDARRVKKIANEFCKSKGFKESSTRLTLSHKGKHAVLTYKRSKPQHSFWKKRKGNRLFKSILCK